MKKIVIAIFVAIFLLASAGIFYLNNVFLPRKIQSLIINTLQEETGKKVTLQRLRFSIFKGLVLNNLVIYDQENRIIILKEASCGFFFPAIFNRKIVIPVIHLYEPQIMLERRKGNSFNLQELLPKKAVSGKERFSVVLYKIEVSDARIIFRDDTFTEPFTRTLEHLNFNLYLSLPASVKFNISTGGTDNASMKISASGEYRLFQKEFLAKAVLKEVSPKEFSKYYQGYGVQINTGTVDALLNVRLKDDFLYLEAELNKKNMDLVKENFSLHLNARTKLKFRYGITDKSYKLEGSSDVFESSVSGLETINSVNNISAQVDFNESGISCSKFNAVIWGIPVAASFTLRDFGSPLLDATVVSRMSLVLVKDILKEKFKLAFPAEITGEGLLSVNIKTAFNQAPAQLKGFLEITKASLKAQNFNFAAGDIKGKLEFTRDSLSFAPLYFSYGNLPYTLEGVLTDFKSPKLQMKLSSPQFLIKTALTIRDKLIHISEGNAKIQNSQFLFSGDIDITKASETEADISAEAKIDLQDTLKFPGKFKDRLQQANPQGTVNMQFRLNGNIHDLKSCAITADISGSQVSFYGIKADELKMRYLQEEGVVNVPDMHLAMYAGTVDTSFKLNLNSQNYPYWVNTVVNGLKVEKLKLDTPAKDKDISGTINADAKVNGFLNDISGLSGGGKIMISEGKIWNLDLFKGMGSLIFTKDFSNIVFQEGSCDFTIAQEKVFTENLLLKSNIANLKGDMSIGFNGSLNASLDVQILDQMVPLTGTLRDVTTAIAGQSGHFGVIKVSGTLKKPKYKFQTAVVDILKGLKKSIFGE